ncbi:hypothetical protein F5884DRAFT_894136 [Xylogone sp. PMI_703]|nr:hypothetical protein F5884DRAFT_894136 [Xylogone sp. PMI_703]
MSQSKYSPLMSDEVPVHSDTIWGGQIGDKRRSRPILLPLYIAIVIVVFIVLSFLLISPNIIHGTLSAEEILPQYPAKVPLAQVEWANDFKWQDTGDEGDRTWNDLMPSIDNPLNGLM